MNKNTTTNFIGKRYAQALFNIASEKKSMLRTVQDDLELFQKTLSENINIQMVFQNQLILKTEQERIATLILEKIKASQITMNFIKILCENRRMVIFTNIVKLFSSLVLRNNKKIMATVIAPYSLTKKQLNLISCAIKNIVNMNVCLNMEIQPHILGGFIIKIGSYIFDTSLLGKIKNITLAMKGEI